MRLTPKTLKASTRSCTSLFAFSVSSTSFLLLLLFLSTSSFPSCHRRRQRKEPKEEKPSKATQGREGKARQATQVLLYANTLVPVLRYIGGCTRRGARDVSRVNRQSQSSIATVLLLVRCRSSLSSLSSLSSHPQEGIPGDPQQRLDVVASFAVAIFVSAFAPSSRAHHRLLKIRTQ